MILSRDIKERALFEGFNKVGIVGAQSLTDEGRRLKEWLARGYHGEMGWMARDVEKRISPHEIFPPARSVVVVALNYFTPDQHQQSSSTGKVSRYAWGDDYHDVVKEKLLSLLAWIREQDPTAQGKVCVDIQPVMDKAWAVRAGLGWLGKHSNVITPEHGSWVFIGELMLNLELDHDTERVEDHCGTCTLCIDACPTAAITEPYVVDSNKCISYATIELRAPELPVELSGWLYGCDICQDVCPWNQRFAKPTDVAEFEPYAENIAPTLAELADISDEEWNRRFTASALRRIKPEMLRRNAKANQINSH